MSGNSQHPDYSKEDPCIFSNLISTTLPSIGPISNVETTPLPPTAPPIPLPYQPIYPPIAFQDPEAVSPFSSLENSEAFVKQSDLPVEDNYSRQVTRLGTIDHSATKVMGMTFIGKILCVLHKRSNVLYKYDTAESLSKNIAVPPVSNQTISGLQYPRGLAANQRTECLFITDRRMLLLGVHSTGRLLKVSLDGAVLAKTDFCYEPFGVSVGSENQRIIVACCKNFPVLSVFSWGYIVIFEDINGKLREQHLISLEESVQVPRSVVEAPYPLRKGHGKEYLIVHGWTKVVGMECHHRVSRISSQGKVLISFGRGHGSDERQLDRPMSVCLDGEDKIFVADCFNNRVLLLTSTPASTHDLHIIRPLITAANGVQRPRHICLDATRMLLYVGQDSGRINIYHVGREMAKV